MPFSVFSKNIIVQLPDTLPEVLANNIIAHLGEFPETEDERNAFIFTSINKTHSALRAMGYYRAIITQAVNKKPSKKNRGIGYFSIGLVEKIEEKIDDIESDAWLLTIDVKLNQPTIISSSSVSVIGQGKNDPSFVEYLAKNTIKINQALSHKRYEEIKAELAAIGVERGYFDGKITESSIAIQEDYSSAAIKIIYQSGKRYHFGDVTFTDFEIEKNLLEKLIPFEHGAPYRTQQLLKLQRQLQQTQYFSSTTAVPDKNNISGDHIPINVSLSKSKSHYFNLGAGYSTDTLFRVSASWRTPLINRYGHRQETKIEYSRVNPRASFIYSIPLSHPINDLLQFQFTLTDEEYGDISSKYSIVKVDNLRINDHWTSQYYLRNLKENWKFDGVENDVNYLLPGVSLSKTTRGGAQLDPSSGFSQYYIAEGGNNAMGSEIDVIRLYGRWRYIQTVSPDHRLVFRGELGTSIIDNKEKDLLPPSLRFFAGGDQSIRGYAYQSLGSTQQLTNGEHAGENRVVGGTSLMVASIEYQYYLSKTWRTIIFTDAGNAEDKLKFKSVHSVGTGLHYLSGIGPIRTDFGYSLSDENPSWRIHFTLGAEL